MKRVLVIVVAYNGMRWLERCLGSVSGADIFVVDNDSTDGSADFVEKHFPNARLVRSAENLGFSKANNLGFEWALRRGYDYVYLLNQDAWLEEGALEKLVAAAEAHPEFAVWSPLQMTDGYKGFDKQFAKILRSAQNDKRVIQNDKRVIQNDKRVIRNDKGIIRNDSGRGRSEAEAIREDTASAGPLMVKRIMAAHWLVPVPALKGIGLFEEEMFPFYGQDDDWCQRARYAGWKVGVVSGARAVHDRAAREEPLERTVFRNYYTGSLVRLADANRPLWERFAFVCLFTVVKAVKYRSLLPFKHFRQICRQLPVVRKHRAVIVARGRRTR